MKKLFSVLFCLFLITTFVFGTGTPVFDVSNYLMAIDQFYQGYDQVMNTIKMIEQQYQQLQMAVQSARNWDWENISWDGDFDFRNEIKNATSQVNDLLSRTQKVQNILTNKQVSIGGVSYTMIDLIGKGDQNKNIFSAWRDGSNAILSPMTNAAKAFAQKLSTEEKKLLWKKYGLSATNYFYTQTLKNEMKSKLSEILSESDYEAKKLRIEERTARTNEIISKIISGEGDDVPQNEIEILQKSALLNAELSKQFNELQNSVADLSAVIAWKTKLEEQEKETEQAALEQIRADTTQKSLNRGFAVLKDDDK